MNFIWAEDKIINDCLVFELNVEKECDLLEVCAVDSYQVFADGRFIYYGPNRAPSGFIRPTTLSIVGVKNLIIKVLSYGTPCYGCDFQESFFGAKLTLNGEGVYATEDFICYRELSRRTNMPRYSRQRGFAEGYDFNFCGKVAVKTERVPAPKILEVGENRAEYKALNFTLEGEGIFNGFAEVKVPWWNKNPAFAPNEKDFNMARDFLPVAVGKYKEKNYRLDEERTGFIQFSCLAKEPTEILLAFDEYLPDDEWIFARSGCNDYIRLKVPVGRTDFIAQEPYAFKYLKVISSNDIETAISLITYENNFKSCVRVSGDSAIEGVFDAAINTFRQNAVDLFTDCPGRERAGWLCDSYFTAKAEQLFTGKNNIEKDFIENYLLAETPEIPEGMLPMCFPSEHTKNTYIPNWAMWFIVELHDYLQRTGDEGLVQRAKEKVYGIIRYLDGFVNEIGLLEDLKGWIFVEWSVCNTADYVKGINFPSNMTYAYALSKAGELYGDDTLIARAKGMQKKIMELSFDGEFFADNAVRENGKIVRCDDHLSETCQYYALFTGLPLSKEYERKVITEFGPFRKEGYPEVGKSNTFIGNYLRLFWLCENGEYDRVLDESVEYFTFMAEKTGTLWEHDSPKASCCHGFASAIAVIMLKCLCGYDGVKEGRVVLDKRFAPSKKYDIKVEFNY